MNSEDLKIIANNIRRDVVKMTYCSGIKGAHLGGSMSIAEVLAVLYGTIMRYDASNPQWELRDRLILSKAHAAMALYAALKYAGFMSDKDIEGAMHGNSSLFEHPQKSIARGIEFSGGSLGQGLSLGMGVALALKRKRNFESRVYVILGDGECNEGQIYEAAVGIGHYSLDNITVIVDENNLQYDGYTREISSKAVNSVDLWKSLGFYVNEADGHDVDSLKYVLDTKGAGKPIALLAKTVKGRGISFAENKVEWHTGRLTEELYRKALEDLNVGYSQ